MKSNGIHKPEDFFPSLRWEAEVDNLLNNDMYKFTMLDFILAHKEYRWIPVRWKMTIRSKDVKTCNVIPYEVLDEQFRMTRESINGVSQADLSFLRGMTKSDGSPFFREETLTFLSNFKLPKYSIEKWDDGNYEIEFEWPWEESMMWEIPWLKIINTLKLWQQIRREKLSDIEFTQIITWVQHRLFSDIWLFQTTPWAWIVDFGTRRSASTEIQRMVLRILQWTLWEQYQWTSNVLLANEQWSNNPKWSRAHELVMIPTALHDHPDDIINSMYEVDRNWMKDKPDQALLLPDTNGTSFFLKNCPRDIVDMHIGIRPDSKTPEDAVKEYDSWLQEKQLDPQEKMMLLWDGLNAQKVVSAYNDFHERFWNLGFAIGTNLTNNTKGLWPRKKEQYGPFWSFSVVIKPSEIWREDLWEWVSCVKLSDNPTKAVWSPERVKLFQSIFWAEWMSAHSVNV